MSQTGSSLTVFLSHNFSAFTSRLVVTHQHQVCNVRMCVRVCVFVLNKALEVQLLLLIAINVPHHPSSSSWTVVSCKKCALYIPPFKRRLCNEIKLTHTLLPSRKKKKKYRETSFHVLCNDAYTLWCDGEDGRLRQYLGRVRLFGVCSLVYVY